MFAVESIGKNISCVGKIGEGSIKRRKGRKREGLKSASAARVQTRDTMILDERIEKKICISGRMKISKRTKSSTGVYRTQAREK